MQKRKREARREAFWALPKKEVFEKLDSSENGLKSEQVRERLEKYGKNDIGSEKKHKGLKILLSQFESPFILVLIAAAVISYFLHESIDATVILVTVLLCAFLGFFQEYRAEKAVQTLKTFVRRTAKVLRDKQIQEIDSTTLVPGDIVPADIRLVEVDTFSANEAILTGESRAVFKATNPISESYTGLYQLSNIALMGTSVQSGMALGVVFSTGKSTFLGKIAQTIDKKTHKEDFQKNMQKFSSFLLKIIFIMTLFVFVANSVLGRGILTSLMFAVALAVGVAPEILPIITTVSLSSSALKMADKKVVIKKLVAIEDLGNMDILCSDKTGTLTEGSIKLYDYLDLNGNNNKDMLLHGLLCNSLRKGNYRSTGGTEIDRAIWKSEQVRFVEKELNEFKILDENTFDFERRRMSVVVEGKRGRKLLCKGAPESVLEVCSFLKVDGKMSKIDKRIEYGIKKKISEYESQGYVVLGLAEKHTTKIKTDKEDEKEMILTGFMLFFDPPRSSAKESLRNLEELKVNIKIISGDSLLVTKKVCEEVGLKVISKVISGEELDRLDEVMFGEYCNKYNVFARISPTTKAKIVESLSRQGHIVGYLGDGTNDVPALKAADVGISVNSATGIAKEAADVILLHKSLNVIADGIMQGRIAFGNITKYTLNTMSANLGNMTTVALSSAFLPFIPLLPSQILLINFLSDIPLITFPSDNVDKEFLRKPKKWNMKIMGRFMLFFGLISTIFDVLFLVFLLSYLKVIPEAFRTAWFVESILSELIITFSIRTAKPFYKSSPSKILIIASIVVAVLTISLTFMTLGQQWFEFVKLSSAILIVIPVVLVLYFISCEIAKKILYKKIKEIL
jgi:Mg2+-importing ATPase